jgi:hypothetical protein
VVLTSVGIRLFDELDGSTGHAGDCVRVRWNAVRRPWVSAHE